MCVSKKIINNITENMELINDESVKYNTILDNTEKAIKDIEHKIEFTKFNASDGYKLAKKLKLYKQVKRECLDNLNKLQFLEKMYYDNLNFVNELEEV